MDEDVLARAIRERRVVEFRYAGEDRTVEPYRLTRAGGRLLLQGWQSRKGWRSFHVDAIEGLEPTSRFFDAPREGFAPDPRLDGVVASVRPRPG